MLTVLTDPAMNLVAYAVPFFLLAICLEWAWGLVRRRNTYRINDTVSSLMLGILSQAQKFVVLGVGAGVYQWASEITAVPQWRTDHWFTWVLAFVLYDLCYYWLHRFGHERQILWAAHVVHHQSEDYNLGTALRQTSTGFVFGWIFYVPLFFLGVPAEVVLTVGSLNLIYQFWVHTQHVPELGWFEWIFVSPSNHRVHHAQNDCYVDRNYGGVFIVWDRLFGTYQPELPDQPCIYGIRGPLRSWNPLWALTHIYVDMLADMVRTGSWRDKARVLFARTGWQPADLAQSLPRHKGDLQHFQRFDPPTSARIRGYAVLQLGMATCTLAIWQWTPVEVLANWLLWTLLMWTGIATATWLSTPANTLAGIFKPLVIDVPRLLLLVAMAATWPAPWQPVFLAWGVVSLLCVLFLSVFLTPITNSTNKNAARLPARRPQSN